MQVALWKAAPSDVPRFVGAVGRLVEAVEQAGLGASYRLSEAIAEFTDHRPYPNPCSHFKYFTYSSRVSLSF